VTYIYSGKLPATLWRSRAAASSLRSTFQGTGVLGAGLGTGPCAVAVQSVPRVRGHVVFAIPVPPKAAAPAVQLGQPNSDNYMASANAIGVTAVGPPQHREPV
jgi:hypothetical protein